MVVMEDVTEEERSAELYVFFTGPHQTIFFTVTVPFSTKRELVSFKSLS